MNLFVLMVSFVFASEPAFTTLKKGQKAPFSGRLFNDEAVSKLIVDNRLKAEQCNIEIKFHTKRAVEREKYNYNLLSAKCEAADEYTKDILSIKEDEIVKLNKLIKPNRNMWWLSGGFVAGVGTSIAIMHAVK
tara:strand:+ start:2359 stop:2757 length:399 start_codon:yes stop_codon:yes gene_type:complete